MFSGDTKHKQKPTGGPMSALIRYETPFATLPGLLDEVFNDGMFGWLDRDVTGTRWPRVDITEEENEYRIRADVPGVDKSSIKVSVENGLLTIRGEKKEEHKEHKKGNYAYFERSFGTFSRSFNLPDHVDEANVKALCKDGVLELTLHKTEAARPKTIEVKVE
jgi:HSP20 family protein